MEQLPRLYSPNWFHLSNFPDPVSVFLLDGTPMSIQWAKFKYTNVVIFFFRNCEKVFKKGDIEIWGIVKMNNSSHYLASRKGQLRTQKEIGVAVFSIIDKCTLEKTQAPLLSAWVLDILLGTQQKHDFSPGCLPCMAEAPWEEMHLLFQCWPAGPKQ